jgi:hypothetical protein
VSILWRRFHNPNPAWLVALPLALCLTDLAVTLYGQSPRYWRGHFDDVLEDNPIGWVFLRWHPWAFALGVLVWAASFAAVIRYGSRPLALTACLALIVGHTMGTCSWLPIFLPFWVGVGVGAGFWLITVILAWPTWQAWRDMCSAWLCGHPDPVGKHPSARRGSAAPRTPLV